MTAVSLKVGVGVRLIKPAKLYMCIQKHYKHNEDKRTVLGIISSHGTLLLSHMGNIVTGIGIQQQPHKTPGSGQNRYFGLASSRSFVTIPPVL